MCSRSAAIPRSSARPWWILPCEAEVRTTSRPSWPITPSQIPRSPSPEARGNPQLCYTARYARLSRAACALTGDTHMVLRSRLTRVLAAVVLAGLPACAAAPLDKRIEGGPVDAGAGSLTQARRFLEGRWSLQSFEVRSPGKPLVQLKGSGTLTYDEFSNLTIEIRADRASSDLLRASGIDIRDDGLISSSGRTAVDMPNRTLTYVIQGQPAAGRGPLALNRPRHWQVEGDVLTTDDEGRRRQCDVGFRVEEGRALRGGSPVRALSLTVIGLYLCAAVPARCPTGPKRRSA